MARVSGRRQSSAWVVLSAWLLGGAGGVAVSRAASPTATDQYRASEPGAPFAGGPDDVGATLTQRTCKDQCHTEDRITETRRAAFEWARLVLDMEARGARATEEEFATIQGYLQRRFGFVNVNRASASDLRAVLGLDRQVAAAVVDHRKRHGPFADVAALAEVPGVDRATLEAQVDALRFN